MIESLKTFAKQHPNGDAYSFLPSLEKSNTLRIHALRYKEPGEEVKTEGLGKIYDIILVQFVDDDVITEYFEASLTHPLEYISNLVESGMYGVVARKTTTSYNNIIKNILEITGAKLDTPATT